jgi:16S rRNA (cytidine1402-2'-O)-methyltransferase
MLYIISTPIGNLEDITYRAVRILSACDYILSEDTRKSSILLNHYKIKKKLISFHKFNEQKRLKKIIEDLENQKNIALISSAGTPTINDPGNSLIQRCIEKKIEITALPGPCSVITALTLSGFDIKNFQFIGFFPKKKSKKTKILKEISIYDGISIFFESKNRLLKTLKLLEEVLPEKEIVIARELTKKFEECIRGNPKELLKHFSKKNPKGEIIVLIS